MKTYYLQAQSREAAIGIAKSLHSNSSFQATKAGKSKLDRFLEGRLTLQVDSSWQTWARYDPAGRYLHIGLRNGGEVAYGDISLREAREYFEAPSKGEWVWDNIHEGFNGDGTWITNKPQYHKPAFEHLPRSRKKEVAKRFSIGQRVYRASNGERGTIISYVLDRDHKPFVEVRWDNGSESTERPGKTVLEMSGSAVLLKGIIASGLALQAMDTGRVLMLQRALEEGEKDENGGKWEFPSGHIQEKE